MGVTRTNGIPPLAGQQQLQGDRQRRQARRLQATSTRAAMAFNTGAARRPAGDDPGRLQLPGRQAAARTGRRSPPSSPRRSRPAGSTCGPQSMAIRIEHDDSGMVTGVVYVDADGHRAAPAGARLVAVACNAIETARLLLNSASSLFPDGLANSSRPGRAQLHAPPDRRRCTPSSTSPCACTAARRWPGIVDRRIAQRPGARLRRRLLHAAALARRAVPGRVPEPGRAGAATSPTCMEQYDHMAGMWLVGEDMPQETNRVTLNRDVLDQYGQPVPNVHFDDHPNDVGDARARLRRGRGASTSRRRDAHVPRRRRTRRRTTSAPRA